MYIAYNLDDVYSCTRNKINFSEDNIARGLCTLVPFILNSSYDVKDYCKGLLQITMGVCLV